MTTNGSIANRHNDCGPTCAMTCWKWDVTQLMMAQSIASIKYAVLILNRPITQSHQFVQRLWNNATIRMTVDGGTKRWDSYISEMPEEMQSSIKLPDIITGDFDSITEEILEKYKKKGCKMILTSDPTHPDFTKALMELSIHSHKNGVKAIHTPDQNYTDFTKALMELNIQSNALETQMEHVLVFAQSSGRLDQILGNIQTLFLAREKMLLHPDSKVYLLTDDAISWLLNPGNHIITIPESTRKHKRAWCSLVPIGETCQYVTSSGLKWNLAHQPLKFGELVSTSNAFDGSETVTIKCSHTLLWSMRIPTAMGS